jgi:Fuc2NAc and GlcNAc transferase
LRHYALAKNLIDHPNHRSSHVLPTPRGGGVAFIISFILAILCVGYFDFETLSFIRVLVVAGMLVALLGFLDDHGKIGTMPRFLGHFLVAIFSFYLLGGMPSISFFSGVMPMGFLLNSLAVFYLVWLINLYNFMDGIDGLAGVEALSVCLGAVFIYWFCGDFSLMVFPLILAASVAGFLGWNFPKARIFMGDAGSGFLGLTLGLLSIHAAMVDSVYFWSWLILLGVFIVDATITLLSRLVRGHRIYEAHRSHAYQQAVDYFGGHARVTFSVLIVNVVWLLPWALFVARGGVDGATGAFVAYCPLIVMALVLKAGRETSVMGKSRN